MTFVLILILSLSTSQCAELKIEQIQFRTIESCYSAALRIERDLSQYNARAICIDRSAEKP